MLLFLDAEVEAERARRIEAHLVVCTKCCDRVRVLDRSADEFAAGYKAASPPIPDAGMARSRLIEQIQRRPALLSNAFTPVRVFGRAVAQSWSYSAAVALVALLAVGAVYSQFRLTDSDGSIAGAQAATLPSPKLTPGVASGAAQNCTKVPAENAAQIPVSERRLVFREYGIDYRHASDQFELDHLITPALGGTDDIHNLWPEPYSATEWNAHAKDQIEDLLHDMVCRGQIDLPLAQREIATNWIMAYKHYFHTDHPLPNYSPLRFQSQDEAPKS